MKVLINAKLSESQMESLRGVDPRLQLVRELDPDVARRELRDAEVLLCFQFPGLPDEAPNLKWIQLVSAGAEHLLQAGLGQTDITITTVSGIHKTAISEYTLWAMISLARRMPLVLRESERHEWKPSRLRTYYGEELCGKTLGILGLGAIGRQVATLARCLGMTVLGLRRSGDKAVTDPSVDGLYGPEGMLEMLGRCDFVLVVVPLTPETRGMIGERELRAMKPTAGLINVARGQIVDEGALARALREGWIGGAAFDVFEEEPLPPESELWNLPNLIVTPHMAGQTLPYMNRVTELFKENLRRYLAGEDLLNVLDKSRGY
ncbi:MAG TPA: D-2-hydroxyacid dehydrogenase [Chloroflexota bacterium]|nr:D-2-hydroxyacid dehydrogenase [Chloroflexota bacterium]